MARSRWICSLLGVDLFLVGGLGNLQLLLGQVEAGLQLVGQLPAPLQLRRGHQIRVSLEKPLVLVEDPLGIQVLGPGLGHDSLLGQSLGLQLGPEGDELGLGLAQLLLGLEKLNLHVGIAEAKDDRGGVDGGPRLEIPLLDAPRRHGRDPSHLLRVPGSRSPARPGPWSRAGPYRSRPSPGPPWGQPV